MLLFKLLYFLMVSHFFFFFPEYPCCTLVPSSARGISGLIVNPFKIMYTEMATGYSTANLRLVTGLPFLRFLPAANALADR